MRLTAQARFWSRAAGATLSLRLTVLEDGQVREHGPRLALAADPASRFATLLRVAAEEVSP